MPTHEQQRRRNRHTEKGHKTLQSFSFSRTTTQKLFFNIPTTFSFGPGVADTISDNDRCNTKKATPDTNLDISLSNVVLPSPLRPISPYRRPLTRWRVAPWSNVLQQNRHLHQSTQNRTHSHRGQADPDSKEENTTSFQRFKDCAHLYWSPPVTQHVVLLLLLTVFFFITVLFKTRKLNLLPLQICAHFLFFLSIENTTYRELLYHENTVPMLQAGWCSNSLCITFLIIFQIKNFFNQTSLKL